MSFCFRDTYCFSLKQSKVEETLYIYLHPSPWFISELLHLFELFIKESSNSDDGPVGVARLNRPMAHTSTYRQYAATQCTDLLLDFAIISLFF